MRKQKVLQLLSIFFVLFMFSSTFGTIAYAAPIDSFLIDEVTGWTNIDEELKVHMGSKNTTYAYSSAAVKSAYSTYVTAGISLWGS